MGKASYAYEEIRFDFRDPELTQCHVAIRAEGDCPLGVQGWHHKTFPASRSAVDIIKSMATDSPVLWAQQAPDRR